MESTFGFNPLDYPICIKKPDRLDTTSAWIEHIPFGMFLIDYLRPKTFVELGTHSGVSYCAFCQAVKHLGIDTSCFAVDTWQGDFQAGYYSTNVLTELMAYHDPLYGSFSRLIQSTFDDAVNHFSDSSIDFIHIDGCHTYEAVKHDFEKWFPKLSNKGVVLFHDTNVRERDFGVWRLWEELKVKHPWFEFSHGNGLGLLCVGSEISPQLQLLISMSEEEAISFKDFFYNLGSNLSEKVHCNDKVTHLNNRIREQEVKAGEFITKLTAEKDMAYQALSELYSDTENAKQNLSRQIAELRVSFKTLYAQLTVKESINQELSAKITEISNSTAWEFVELLRKLRIILVPIGSKREKIWSKCADVFRKSSRYFRAHGGKALIVRIFQVLQMKKGTKVETTRPVQSTEKEPNIIQEDSFDTQHIIINRFHDTRPLLGYPIPFTNRRLNMVTDSINSGSLFGGVATAIILSTLIAKKWECDLRVITRTEKPHKKNFFRILEANGITFPGNVEFLHAQVSDPKAEIPIGDGDIFLTTSWWTTQSVKDAFGENRILYLLQEDERAFYPFGDDHLRCTELLLSKDIRFIINTEMLYQHFVQERFENIKVNGLWFEPSWADHLFYYEIQEPKLKKNFFFYARPNNIRNLFFLGLEAIDKAIMSGVLDTSLWDLYFVGKDIPEITLINSYRPIIQQNIGLSDYAALVRKMDLGLSLMYTPHPSYPPLDLAACGAVVVTNRFGLKYDLNKYSKNIICRNLCVDDIVEGIKLGIELANDTNRRMDNYQSNGILRDWNKSFADILNQLEK